jgi:hypothetical protein
MKCKAYFIGVECCVAAPEGDSTGVFSACPVKYRFAVFPKVRFHWGVLCGLKNQIFYRICGSNFINVFELKVQSALICACPVKYIDRYQQSGFNWGNLWINKSQFLANLLINF